MKKINSIHYGGKILIIGIVLAVVIPAVLYLVQFFLKFAFLQVIMWISVAIGILVLVGFFMLLSIELKQDKKIDAYTDLHRNIKMPIGNGFYECANCGNRSVRKKDKSCTICGARFSEDKIKSVQDILED